MDSILIVDDENDNLEALQRLLRKDFDIVATTSPLEALKHLQDREFSVLLSDQRMPELKGVELLEKANTISPRTMRVLLTGYTDFDAIVDAVNRGNIYHYISKPWDPNALQILLKRAAERYNLEREIEVKSIALEKSNHELKKSLEAVRSLDRAKDRFLSLISHELKTPLTILKSFLTLVEAEKESLSADVKTAINSMSGALKRFSDIVEEVILFVKMEAGSFHPQHFSFKHLIQEQIDSLSQLSESKKVAIELVAFEDVEALADRDKVAIAIQSLLQDFIQRSPENKSVQLNIQEEPSFITLSVSREGDPLTNEAFDKFEPTEDPMHHHQGLGLSLALCKMIVEGNMGSLKLVISTAQKTVIHLKLPV